MLRLALAILASASDSSFGGGGSGVQLIVAHPRDGAILHAPETLWLNLQLSVADAERLSELRRPVDVCMEATTPRANTTMAATVDVPSLSQQPWRSCVPLPVPLRVDEMA